ncbi:MAG: hypothetical protein MJY93_03855 [Fibrobacter sp.]|nr:hypothetical protein [Fibrobacter sp.]
MKKILTFSAIAITSLLFTGCFENKANFAGCWQGEANMIFEVIPSGSDFIIRNINGDLNATPDDGKICGKNSLDMVYCMSVKGDSAYYEFGGITTGYKRISKQDYDAIFASQKKATVEAQ